MSQANTDTLIKEDMPLIDSNPYDKSKIEPENLIIKLCKK